MCGVFGDNRNNRSPCTGTCLFPAVHRRIFRLDFPPDVLLGDATDPSAHEFVQLVFGGTGRTSGRFVSHLSLFIGDLTDRLSVITWNASRPAVLPRSRNRNNQSVRPHNTAMIGCCTRIAKRVFAELADYTNTGSKGSSESKLPFGPFIPRLLGCIPVREKAYSDAPPEIQLR